MAEPQNYYELLELPLDPLVTDPAKVMVVIDAKKREWDKQKTGPKALYFKMLTEKVVDMKETLKDSDTLRKQGMDAQEKAKASIRRALNLMDQGKKSIAESDFKKLCVNHPALRQETIKAWTTAAGFKIVAGGGGGGGTRPTQPKQPAGLKLPSVQQLGDLDATLNVLDVASIYDVIGCTPTSSQAALNENIKKFKAKVRKMPKNSVKADAYNKLSPLASTFFADEAAKKGFDYGWANYLATKTIETDIKYAITGNPPSITKDKYLNLIKKLREKGMGEAEAAWFVYDECCNKAHAPYPLVDEDQARQPKLTQCPNCYALNEQGAQSCTKCGNMLVIKCPKCGKMADATHRACSCGFALGDIPLATMALANAKKASAKKDWEQAEEEARIALLYWPKNFEAEAILGQIEALRTREAEELVKKLLQSLGAPASGKVTTTAHGALNISWSRARQAGKEITTPDLALPDGKRMPLQYRLVRKKGATPASVTDGEVLVTTPSTQFEDTTAKPGVVYGYTVFVLVANSAIGTGCNCGMGQIIPAPRQVSVSSGDGSLTLSWTPIDGARGYLLVRKKGGIPSNVRDGEQIPVPASSGTYTDTGLANDTQYGYLFAYKVLDTAGKEALSPTVSTSGTPVCPPPALQPADWSATVVNKEVNIKWQLKSSHQVRWYMSDKDLGSVGALLSLNDAFFSAAQAITNVDQAGKIASCSGQFSGQKYITPVVVQGRHGLVCKSRTVVSLPGVTNLQVQRSQGKIILTWNWPERCENVVVTYGNKSYPTAADDASAAGRLLCTKHQYDLEKALVMNNVGDNIYYFSVFAALKTASGTVYSAVQNALSAGASSRVKLSYELVSKKAMVFFGKKTWQLVITSSGNHIPELEIRSKRDTLPLNRNDGVSVLRTQATAQKTLAIDLPEEYVERGNCFKLFPANPGEAQLISMNHLPAQQLMIN